MIHEQWQQYLNAQPPAPPAAAGMAWVPALAAVRFSGADARKFLQGYLTCDTADLRGGELQPTALCNLKGRVVMSGWCAPADDAADHDVVLVLHDSLVDRLAAFLDPYLRFSRTTLTDLRPTTLVLAGLDLDSSAGGLVLDPRRRLFLVAGLERARELWQAHPHVDAQAWLAALTSDGIPLISAAVSETFLPQMLDLQTLGAVDFEKGCYLGQEVVARAQHRGQVKRHLVRLAWRGAEPPPPGAEITDADGRARGTVLQSAATGQGGGVLLAVLGRDAPHVLRQGEADLSRLE